MPQEELTPATGIVIVGSGIKVPAQLTIEAVAALEHSSEIWTNLPEPEHAELVQHIGRGVNSLWPFFHSDRPRIDNYRDIVAHIISRAACLPSVAYLTQGHPLVLDKVTTELLRHGQQAGIAVSVLPGISSLDTILADVQYEPARGLQIFDATNFVRAGLAVDARAGLLLLQPGVFGIDTPRTTSDAPPPDIGPLRDVLCKIYPPGHPAILVRSATASMKARQFPTTVGGLTSVPPAMLTWSTLWIPPADNGS